MSYTVVIPTYNSESKVGKFSDALFLAMANSPEPVEFVFVDDGSADGTWRELNEIKLRYPAFDIRLIRLSKNCGQLTATNCGILTATNDIIVTVDDDGKYSPAEIPLLIQFWRNSDFELVFGITDWEERALHKSIFYFVIRNIIFPKFNATSFSSFRVFSKNSVQAVFKKSIYGGNLHTLWLFKPGEIGGFPLTTTGNVNPPSRYNALSLIWHQKYLVAYLLLITSALVSFFSASLTGLYAFKHQKAHAMQWLIPFISVIFTILAYWLLRFLIAGSFKFAIREKV